MHRNQAMMSSRDGDGFLYASPTRTLSRRLSSSPSAASDNHRNANTHAIELRRERRTSAAQQVLAEQTLSPIAHSLDKLDYHPSNNDNGYYSPEQQESDEFFLVDEGKVKLTQSSGRTQKKTRERKSNKQQELKKRQDKAPKSPIRMNSLERAATAEPQARRTGLSRAARRRQPSRSGSNSNNCYASFSSLSSESLTKQQQPQQQQQQAIKSSRQRPVLLSRKSSSFSSHSSSNDVSSPAMSRRRKGGGGGAYAAPSPTSSFRPRSHSPAVAPQRQLSYSSNNNKSIRRCSSSSPLPIPPPRRQASNSSASSQETRETTRRGTLTYGQRQSYSSSTASALRRNSSFGASPYDSTPADVRATPRRNSSFASSTTNHSGQQQSHQSGLRRSSRDTIAPRRSSYQPQQQRPQLVNYSSSSSLEDGPRKARRSRRPPRQDGTTSRKGNATGSTTKYLNHSFAMSFNNSIVVSNSSEPDETDEDNQKTPTLAKELFAATQFDEFLVLSDALQFEDSGHLQLDDDESVGGSEVQESDEKGSLPRPQSSQPALSGQESLYELATRCEWDMVADACSTNPRSAKYVCDTDGTTALHLAVMSRANPALRKKSGSGVGVAFEPAPLNVIEQLVLACPEAAIIRCTAKRYTPLSYACLVADPGYDMDDSADMVRILLEHAPHSALVFTDDGFSAVDVHIISYSRLHQEKEEVYSSTGRTSTVVLRALLENNPSLADARTYGARVRGPVELLYRCNLVQFKEASGEDIVSASNKGKSVSKKAFCSVVSTLSDWWAWKWALILLKVASIPNEDDGEELAPFSAVQAASQLVGCPIPVLALALDAFPQQVKVRSPRNGIYNTPLHEVCSWVTDDLQISGDPFVLKRKNKAITLLLEAFPKAARMTNNRGETPLQLAIETCTPWEKGLGALARSFTKALMIPRSLEYCQEDCPLSKAVSLHADDLGSVGSDEDEWGDDPMEAIEGMYPFMIAGALSHVPSRRNHAPPSFLFTDQEPVKHEKSLEIKDLESLRSIFGLLRAKPEALALFIEDERNRKIEEAIASSSSEDESDGAEESATEAFVEEEAQSDYTEELVSVFTEEEILSSVASTQYTEVEVQSQANSY